MDVECHLDRDAQGVGGSKREIKDRYMRGEFAVQLLAASAAKASCLVNLGAVSQKEENINECFTWCDKALRYGCNWLCFFFASCVLSRSVFRCNRSLLQESLLATKSENPAGRILNILKHCIGRRSPTQ